MLLQPGIVDPGDEGCVFRNFATFSALSECFHWRSGRVSSPWRKRNALKGLKEAPRSRSNWTLTLMMKATFPGPGSCRSLPELQAMVARVRLRELGELPLALVELPRVHDDAADRRPVSSYVLGRETSQGCPRHSLWALTMPIADGVVDDKWDARFVRYLCDAFKVRVRRAWGCRSSRRIWPESSWVMAYLNSSGLVESTNFTCLPSFGRV